MERLTSCAHRSVNTDVCRLKGEDVLVADEADLAPADAEMIRNQTCTNIPVPILVYECVSEWVNEKPL